jgi:hypothetical protein
MFIISQYLLHKTNLCSSENISTYSIAVGLIIYSAIYLYILYYNNDFLFIFNKFMIFIIGIDLLLSTFYHFNNENIQKLNNINFEESYLIENNNKIQEHLSISDDELTEDFDEDLDEEVDNEDFEDEETTINEILNEQLQEIPNEQLQEIQSEQLQEMPNEQLQEIQSEQLQEMQSEHLQEIPTHNEIEKLLKSIPIDNNEIVIEKPKPKAKRQPKKKVNKIDQVL